MQVNNDDEICMRCYRIIGKRGGRERESQDTNMPEAIFFLLLSYFLFFNMAYEW